MFGLCAHRTAVHKQSPAQTLRNMKNLTDSQLAELKQHFAAIYAILGISAPVLPTTSICYTSKTKSELADMAGTSTRTFSKWLQPFREELRRMGVSDRTKLLPPQAVRFVCENLDIDFQTEFKKR